MCTPSWFHSPEAKHNRKRIELQNTFTPTVYLLWLNHNCVSTPAVIYFLCSVHPVQVENTRGNVEFEYEHQC